MICLRLPAYATMALTRSPTHEGISSAVRTIHHASWHHQHVAAGPSQGAYDLLTFEITADGFLYKQVRGIVGACWQVLSGKASMSDFPWQQGARSRSRNPSAASIRPCRWSETGQRHMTRPSMAKPRYPALTASLTTSRPSDFLRLAQAFLGFYSCLLSFSQAFSDRC